MYNDNECKDIEKCVELIGEGVELLEAHFGRHHVLDSARSVLSNVLKNARMGADPVLLAAICAGLMMGLDNWQAAMSQKMEQELARLRDGCNVPPDRTWN